MYDRLPFFPLFQHEHHGHPSPSLREKTLLLTRMMVFYEKRFPDDMELQAQFLDVVLFVYKSVTCIVNYCMDGHFSSSCS